MKKKQLTPNRVIVTFALFFLLTIDTGFYSSERMSGTIRLIISIAAVGLIIITRLQKTILSNPFFSRLNRTFLFFVLSLILPVIYGNFNTNK